MRAVPAVLRLASAVPQHNILKSTRRRIVHAGQASYSAIVNWIHGKLSVVISMDPHNRARHADNDDDPVTLLLKQSGCYEVNTALQECMFEHKDWRKCQSLVTALKECMEKHKKPTWLINFFVDLLTFVLYLFSTWKSYNLCSFDSPELSVSLNVWMNDAASATNAWNVQVTQEKWWN